MMSTSIWPKSARAAISFTIDNLGEAQEINSGTWPAEKPIGHHHSVKLLPDILKIFKDANVTATFFFETWSSTIYPDVVKSVTSDGHELGWHGYQHEKWTKLSQQEEIDLFEKSFHQAERLGLDYKGFRPPGGLVNDGTYDLLHRYGIRYISPAARRAAVVRDVAVVPFQWETIDAYYYMSEFSKMRQLHGLSAESLEASALKKYFLDLVEEAVRSNGYVSILFHTFLQTSDERLALMREVVEEVSKDPRVWCAPCGTVADWILKHPESFTDDPGWITESW